MHYNFSSTNVRLSRIENYKVLDVLKSCDKIAEAISEDELGSKALLTCGRSDIYTIIMNKNSRSVDVFTGKGKRKTR